MIPETPLLSPSQNKKLQEEYNKESGKLAVLEGGRLSKGYLEFCRVREYTEQLKIAEEAGREVSKEYKERFIKKPSKQPVKKKGGNDA